MRLIGYVEGIEISFDFYPPNTFVGVIPKRLNGSYAVELHAVDEAGNISNQTGLYVLIDFQQMGFKVLDDSYEPLANVSDFSSKEVLEEFLEQNDISNYSYDVIDSEFSFRELVIK